MFGSCYKAALVRLRFDRSPGTTGGVCAATEYCFDLSDVVILYLVVLLSRGQK
jgi:hypothetical protein